MNGKFFTLPEEKQKRIINAAYVVFANSSYKRHPCPGLRLPAGYQSLCCSTISRIRKSCIYTSGRISTGYPVK